MTVWLLVTVLHVGSSWLLVHHQGRVTMPGVVEDHAGGHGCKRQVLLHEHGLGHWAHRLAGAGPRSTGCSGHARRGVHPRLAATLQG
eukprot:10879108-Alexandrium_andersonii.AAC.1